ncbi:DNA repair protein [Jannaschia rubra]|uniref:DNA repair protein n=1 Tax=Jannaschia rubra TaxID=282197 RepID=UPI0024921B9D|nr:DNA repair protein [Jannaschia rubra]
MNDMSRSVAMATTIIQQISGLVLLFVAVALLVATGGAALGLLPWIDLPVSIGGAEVAQAGMIAQIGLTLLVLLLLGFLPANARVRRLELTSRRFHLSMDDVTRAYAAVHAADRDGVFGLSREFDAMRERIEWMRNHPDLATLEPDVMEVAAQMSVESRDLAQVYSTEKLDRARTFLKSRQEEIDGYRERIDMARSTVEEIRRWTQAVSVEERTVEKQLDRLKRDFAELIDGLPQPGRARPRNVVGMPRPRRDGSDRLATPAE